MKSFLIRITTGIFFVAALLGAMLYNYVSFGILFAIVSRLAVNEFCNIVHGYKKTSFSTLLAVLGGVYLFFILFAISFLSIGKPMMLVLPYIFLVLYIHQLLIFYMILYKKANKCWLFKNYFFVELLNISFTISTIGITMNAIPIEIAYCATDKVVNEKTFARGFIKTNNVESTKDTPPANQSILF